MFSKNQVGFFFGFFENVYSEQAILVQLKHYVVLISLGIGTKIRPEWLHDYYFLYSTS